MLAHNGYSHGISGCWPAMETAMVMGDCWPTRDAALAFMVAGQAWRQPWWWVLLAHDRYGHGISGCWPAMETSMMVGGVWPTRDTAMALVVACGCC